MKPSLAAGFANILPLSIPLISESPNSFIIADILPAVLPDICLSNLFASLASLLLNAPLALFLIVSTSSYFWVL